MFTGTKENAVSCDWGVFASAYFDNELGPSERVWFEEHLLSCVACTLDLEAFMVMQQVIQSVRIEDLLADPSEPLEDATCN